MKASVGDNNSDPSFLDSYFETKWRGLMDDKYIQSLYVNTFNDEYGRWLIEHNAVIKINDIIFAHGGISEKYSTWTLQRINDALLTKGGLSQECGDKFSTCRTPHFGTGITP